MKFVKFANNFMKFVEFASNFMKFIEFVSNFTKFMGLANNFYEVCTGSTVSQFFYFLYSYPINERRNIALFNHLTCHFSNKDDMQVLSYNCLEVNP